MKLIPYAIVLIIFTGCAYYPNLDYVRYYGLDYGYRYGSKNKIYYSESGRVTSSDDKIIGFSIGAKKLKEFNDDRTLASNTITAEIVKREGFCPNGYKIKFDPSVSQGDMGFGWTVFCD